MNTRIMYLYRDAGNNKVFGSVVVEGLFSESQVEWVISLLARCPENGFIPSKVGLPELRENFAAGASYDEELDHEWHEWEGVEPTDEAATVDLSASDLLENFAQIENEGWDSLSSVFG